MFVVGVVKYGERVWALWCAGRSSQAGGSNYRSVERYDRPAVFVGQAILPLSFATEYYIARAHEMLYVAKDLLFKGATSALRVMEQYPTRIERYHVAEVQLSLMHDLFYTKTVVMRSWHGISIRIISVLATDIVLLLFHLSGAHKDFHSTLDIVVTYIILVGAVVMEIVSVVRVMFSSWVWWKPPVNFKWYCRLQAVVCLRRLVRAANWRRNCSWSHSMGQHNMLRLCARSRASLSSKVARWMGVEDPWNILAYSWSVPVTDFIRDQMVHHLYFNRPWKPVHIINVQGREELRRWGLYGKLGWSVEESILVWQIATDLYLCWYKEEQKATTSLWEVDARWQANATKAVEVLSNYMLFLLAVRPHMLPSTARRDAYVQTCYALLPPKGEEYILPPLEYSSAEDLASSLRHLGDALNKGSPRVELEDTDEVIGRSDSIIIIPITTAKLGAKLVVEEASSSSGNMLKLILEVWMDMLLYVGSQCSAYLHAKQLSNGGELITIAALLLKYEILQPSDEMEGDVLA